MDEPQKDKYILKEIIAIEQFNDLVNKRYMYAISVVFIPVATVLTLMGGTMANISAVIVTLLAWWNGWLFVKADARIQELNDKYGEGKWKAWTLAKLRRQGKV